jgi:hypothetical protein
MGVLSPSEVELDMNTPFEEFRKAARSAIEAHQSLLESWKRLDGQDYTREASPDDVRLLKDLIIRRIYPANIFEVLARVDWDAASAILLSRYLGKGVDPDTKFGGYSFELSSLLEDYCEKGGYHAIRSLLSHPDFDRAKLSDPRVSEVLCSLLHIEPEQLFEYRVEEKHESGKAF